MFGPQWIDSVGHPPGYRLVSAGYKGAFLYVGFPERPKCATRALVDDYRANGIELACIVEDTTEDALNPYNGARYAQAAVNHMTALGLPATTPVECTADRHLTVSDVATALEYTDAFRMALELAGWRGPVGVYGFAEYTGAAWTHALADWTHVAGAQRTLAPHDTFWQDNTTKTYVSGVQVDVNYQLRPFRPLTPVEDTMDRLTLPAGGTLAVPTREPIILPVDRQAVITIGVEGNGTVVHGYGWGEKGGTGFDGAGPVVDQGVLVLRPPKGTGKVDVQYSSNSDLECVVDYVG
jgi:hypothetical protein